MSGGDNVLGYPVLKQKLIDARDRLDGEVVVLRRMHEFATRLLRADDCSEPAALVAEGIVDVFDLEVGLCWILDEHGWPVGPPGALGVNAPPMELINVGRLLAARYQNREGVVTVDRAEASQLSASITLEHGLVAICRDDRGQPSALLVGGVSALQGPFIDRSDRVTEEAFGLFAAQTGAMLARQRSAERLEALNQSLMAVLRAIPDSLFELDGSGRYLSVWSQDEGLLVRPSGELLGCRIDDVMPQEAATMVHAGLREAAATGSSRGRQICLNLDGKPHWFELSIARKDSDPSQSLFTVLSRDVTERKEADQRLRESEDRAQHHASFDALTALPNRLQVISRLEELTASSQFVRRPLGLLFIDLDEFKKINDSLGHSFGDQVLLEAAQRIARVVAGADMIGRLGGDEFVVITEPGGETGQVSDLVDTVLDVFRRPFLIRDREVTVTASIGVAHFPADSVTSGDLFRKADVAMYHAKSLGRNLAAFYEDTLNQGVERRLEIEEQLSGALSRGEIAVCYQPKFAIGRRRIEGVEALIRWTNPKLGAVAPSEFVPIAEKTTQILELGRYVLQQAVFQAARWNRALGRPFSVAVNVSPRQFRDPAFLPLVRQVLHRSGLPADCLELEITEGILMGADGELDHMLSELKRSGARLVMDDFGTGYSSLSYLRTYPFDALKVDQSFVRDMLVDSADRELVSAAVAMGHGLGLAVVAEGVEDAEQLQALEALNADYAQGYLFSRPVSWEHINSLLNIDQSQSQSDETGSA